MYGDSPNLPILRMPWEDPATAFRSAGHVIPPEIAAKKAAAALAEAQAVADQAQVSCMFYACLSSDCWCCTIDVASTLH